MDNPAQIAADLRATATWLAEHNWHKGRMYSLRFGAPRGDRPWTEVDECHIQGACAYGALMIVTGARITRELGKGSRTYEAFHGFGAVHGRDLIDLNDQVDVTKEDILKFLNETADKIEKEAVDA